MAFNKRLKRTNIRCHLFCKETQKSRHQTFARLARRYIQGELIEQLESSIYI